MRAPLALAAFALLCACQQAQPDHEAAIQSAANAIAPGPPAAAAPALPALTGRVVDNANLLTPAQEADLTTELAALERRTSDQLVIVTTPSLNGQAIEAFGTALGNRWGIGQTGRDNGVLLIVAPAERKVRIEVGYGLEAILTNTRAHDIIERDMLPAFRRDNDFSRGIAAGTHRIAALLVAQENVPRRRQR